MTALADEVRGGDRRALARAITLVESTRDDHRADAVALLDELLPATGGAARIGVSGPPGAGKSTLVEALGNHLVDSDHRVAVLAVDPSSARSGGSILGDKTRMAELARRSGAFIRPSPSGGTLGGVARRTREALLLCEAAGFDVVLVETVGVGQSEVTVADLVDALVLVAAPAAGDELQGMKRGIVEVADVIVVNKADGDLAPHAERTCADLRSAVHMLGSRRGGWDVEVSTASALSGAGIPELWTAIERFVAHLDETGMRAALRSEQSVQWMWREITEVLTERVRTARSDQVDVEALERAVAAGERSPASAARDVLARAFPDA